MGPLEILPVLPDRVLPQSLVYLKEETDLGKQLNCSRGPQGWLHLPDNRLLIPEALGRTLIQHLHQGTHLGSTRLSQLLARHFYIPHLSRLTQSEVSRCLACAKVNPNRNKNPEPGTRQRGQAPGEHWEIDLTEVKPRKFGYKYLLVFIDSYSGWAEAYLTKGETAAVVVRHLLAEIIPRFGLPLAPGSDNGPAFIAKVSQSIARALGIFLEITLYL